MGFQQNAFYNIKNLHSELQLAISRGSSKDGAQLIQWPADGTDAQVFLIIGSEPDLQILPLTTLLTLGISGGSPAPGAPVVQWTPDSSPSQRFLLTPAQDGYQTITSESSRLVLGIAGGSVEKGAAVVQWTPVGSPDQMFALDDAGQGYVSLRNRNSGMLLAISGGSGTPGTALIQWPADGSDAQKFLLVGAAEAGYMILPKGSVKVLGIAGGSTAPGAEVVQWHPDGSANQQFGLADVDTDFAMITSPATGLVLGIAGGTTAPAANVVQWTSTGAANQRFGLTQISRARQPLTAADLAPGTDLLRALHSYCPELRLHPLERYLPDAIEHFVNSSQVRNAPGEVVLSNPDSVDLVQFGAWGSQPGHADKDAYYLSPPRDWSDPVIHGQIPVGRVPIGSGTYRGGYAGGSVSVPMAARGFSVNGTYWFDYLFFYPYNGEQILQADMRDGSIGHAALSPMATHIGDWEHAQVQVRADLRDIIAIRVFNHGDPVLIRNSADDPAWRHLKFTDVSHPILYSGLHSHSTYSAPGHHLQDLGSVVNNAIHFSIDIERLKACDWCDDGGATWQGWTNLVPFGVDGSGRALPGFPGMAWPDFYPHRWGKSRTFSTATDLDLSDVGPGVAGVPPYAWAEILAGIEAGLWWGVSELTDGLGVSPPDWWRSGF